MRLKMSAESDEDHLQTPNCSSSGYEDEENTTGGTEEAVEAGAEENTSDEQWGNEEEVTQVQVEEKTHRGLLSPGTILNCDDIDTDNLAADFDGSFTGLGVDINTANYSMSEAMMSLNNIAVQQMVKEEASGSNSASSKILSLKSEPAFMFSNYGALDLSNDDANHPDGSEESPSPQNKDPPTFHGSVSRENSQEAKNLMEIRVNPAQKRASNIVKNVQSIASSGDFRIPNQQSVILTYSKQGNLEISPLIYRVFSSMLLSLTGHPVA